VVAVSVVAAPLVAVHSHCGAKRSQAPKAGKKAGKKEKIIGFGLTGGVSRTDLKDLKKWPVRPSLLVWLCCLGALTTAALATALAGT
jgi:hypothetical protein